MLNDAEYKKFMEDAEKRCTDMDRVEKESCFASPQDISQMDVIRTAVTALGCAIRIEDWGTAGEAYVLLNKYIVEPYNDKVTKAKGN